MTAETLTAETSTQSTASPTTWVIDPAHTLVEFSAKHMMVTTVKGRFAELSGTIAGDETNPADATVEVTIDATSIDSRNDQRDTHLRSADFLDTEHFPDITFVATSVRPTGDDEFEVTGDLTIRGITRPITLHATVEGKSISPWGTEVVGISATGGLNRSDFGLTWNVALEAGGVLVSDRVKIAIELEAIKQ